MLTLINRQAIQEEVINNSIFPVAIELIRNTTIPPESKDNPNHKNEILHRFTGVTHDGHIFYIHIRENKRNGNKSIFSVFPEQKQDKISR